jgi:hypothetical protein
LRIKRREKDVLEVRGRESSTDPYSMFLFAMRSPKTREKCSGRLRMFFDFIDVPTGSMAKRSKAFCDRAKYDNGWVFSVVVQYLQNQKERVERKEIRAGTMKNYFQAIKLFCDMADIPISWKKISRGILSPTKNVT